MDQGGMRTYIRSAPEGAHLTS